MLSMPTPFDYVVDHIVEARYHNHRKEEHSDIVSNGIVEDLKLRCDSIRDDFDSARIQAWRNIVAPGTGLKKERTIDLLIAEPDGSGVRPDLSRARLAIENKSVATAHRNKSARAQIMDAVGKNIQAISPEVILLGTVIVGTAVRYLNIPDAVKKFYSHDFDSLILPRLSTGDQSLWDDYGDVGTSPNSATDASRTVQYFRDNVAVRSITLTHQPGYDYLLIVPMHINNVDPPRVDRSCGLVDHDKDYGEMLDTLCSAYSYRFGPSHV